MSRGQLSSWKSLAEHAKSLGQEHLNELFASNPNRFDELTYQFDSLFVDFSKQRITSETLELLLGLADEVDLSGWIEQLFTGAHVNQSEDRAALHMALRVPRESGFIYNGVDIVPGIQANFDRMETFVEQLHAQQWRGYSGLPISNVVNIGVGGSDLGAVMACEALRGSRALSEDGDSQIEINFVSSMDGSQLARLLERLDPARTLFIISSKSFSTIDTLANAATAREWLVKSTSVDPELLLRRHFIGISCQAQRMSDWGIPQDNQLELWDWVGGRYSMWSAIGLPIAILIGMDGFRQMLAGANAMDRHFRSANLNNNIPVLLALVGIYNINFLDIHAQAILPYDGRLAHLPAYLEQLAMESNGKRVDREGAVVEYHTCPIIWGEIGSNAQHAFYQLLHQGTESVMCDFVVTAQRYAKSNNPELIHQHTLSLSNSLAQSMILAFGDSGIPNHDEASQPAWKRYAGNQPNSTLVLDELNPYSFGQLIALYEHQVFVQSVIWNINPFDQWGVELGKTAATMLIDNLQGRDNQSDFDGSTKGLVNFIRRSRESGS